MVLWGRIIGTFYSSFPTCRLLQLPIAVRRQGKARWKYQVRTYTQAIRNCYGRKIWTRCISVFQTICTPRRSFTPAARCRTYFWKSLRRLPFLIWTWIFKPHKYMERMLPSGISSGTTSATRMRCRIGETEKSARFAQWPFDGTHQSPGRESTADMPVCRCT